jgi:hypothetical protein
MCLSLPWRRSSLPSTVTPFQYRPLEVDSIRVIHLQPRRDGQKIECTLSHVAYRDRPQYNALSYAWGDETPKRIIFLDGIEFEVGENLAKALINIRGLESAGEGPQILWIDAICINQSDLVERSHQVRLMPHIYARAQMVLVWLGSSTIFKTYCRMESDHPKKSPKHSRSIGEHHGPIMYHTVRDLCRRPYWKRLWIIQEIGKSRYRRIHYDNTAVEWSRFMENIKLHRDLANSVPLKLDTQVNSRYHHQKLSNLLMANHRALCKDPRDKIYGLLGLATDVDARFPISYSKSLFEVFAEAIFFVNKDKTSSQYDILQMVRLVERTLGGVIGLEPDELARSLYTRDISLEPGDDQFGILRVPGRLAGRIEHIGPLFDDMIGRIEMTNEWNSLIWNGISEPVLRSTVLEQSDLFLEALEQYHEFSQRTVFTFDRNITWNEAQQYSIETLERNYGTIDGTNAAQLADPVDNGSRLFLLQPPTHINNTSWMGLAPRGTKAGDFVVQIRGMERAVIVRQSYHTAPALAPSQINYTYKIIGCAGLAKDGDTARQLRGVRLAPNCLFSAGALSTPAESEHLNLYMDICTAQEVSHVHVQVGEVDDSVLNR